MQNMAEAGQLHKSALASTFSLPAKRRARALKLMASAFAAAVFRNVLRLQWTTGFAEAQGAKCLRVGLNEVKRAAQHGSGSPRPSRAGQVSVPTFWLCWTQGCAPIRKAWFDFARWGGGLLKFVEHKVG
jgi:hypothetical protein